MLLIHAVFVLVFFFPLESDLSLTVLLACSVTPSSLTLLHLDVLFKFNLFFIFGCAGSLLLGVGKWGLLFILVWGPLVVMASLVVEREP